MANPNSPTPAPASTLRRLAENLVARWKSGHAFHEAQARDLKVREELFGYTQRELVTLGFGGTALKLTAVRKQPVARPAAAVPAPDLALQVENDYGTALGEAGMGVLTH